MGSEKLRYKDCSLKFEVYDFDLMSADDAMGSATLPLTHFAKMKAKFKDGKVREGRRRKGDRLRRLHSPTRFQSHHRKCPRRRYICTK